MKQRKTFFDCDQTQLVQQINQWLRDEAISQVQSVSYQWLSDDLVQAFVVYEAPATRQPQTSDLNDQRQKLQRELVQVMQILLRLPLTHPYVPALRTRANLLEQELARLNAQTPAKPSIDAIAALRQKYQKQIQQMDEALWEHPNDLVLLSSRAIYLQMLQDLEELSCHSE